MTMQQTRVGQIWKFFFGDSNSPLRGLGVNGTNYSNFRELVLIQSSRGEANSNINFLIRVNSRNQRNSRSPASRAGTLMARITRIFANDRDVLKVEEGGEKSILLLIRVNSRNQRNSRSPAPRAGTLMARITRIFANDRDVLKVGRK